MNVAVYFFLNDANSMLIFIFSVRYVSLPWNVSVFFSLPPSGSGILVNVMSFLFAFFFFPCKLNT
jgi:hypothetical protein